MNCTSWPAGSEPTDGAAPRPVPPLRRLGAGGLAVVLAASLFGCAGGGTGSPSDSGAATSASGAPAGGEGTGPGEDRDGAPQDASPAEGGAADRPAERVTQEAEDGQLRAMGPAEPGEPAVVEGGGTGEEQRSTTEPVVLDEPARPAEGLEITVGSTAPVQAEGMGPGGVSGPALAVVVQVRNTTDAPVSTLGSSVNVTYGSDDRPASPSRQPGDEPLPAEVAPGETVSGTYTFLVPEDQREDVVITASYRATDPAAVFAGPAREDGAQR